MYAGGLFKQASDRIFEADFQLLRNLFLKSEIPFRQLVRELNMRARLHQILNFQLVRPQFLFLKIQLIRPSKPYWKNPIRNIIVTCQIFDNLINSQYCGSFMFRLSVNVVWVKKIRSPRICFLKFNTFYANYLLDFERNLCYTKYRFEGRTNRTCELWKLYRNLTWHLAYPMI